MNKSTIFGIVSIILIISVPDVSAEERRGILVSDKFIPSEYSVILAQDDWPTHIQRETVEVIYEPSKDAFDATVKKAIESQICELDVAVKKTIVTRWSPSTPPSWWIVTYVLQPCEVAATM